MLVGLTRSSGMPAFAQVLPGLTDRPLRQVKQLTPAAWAAR
jgi:hypothetical protein